MFTISSSRPKLPTEKVKLKGVFWREKVCRMIKIKTMTMMKISKRKDSKKRKKQMTRN